ncbi:glycosyltransferase [Dysgonomonas sp. ZJ709]|uniref:glycosyltransferase n=1 Tax=Dysgonomonas sp. ZJ709 TaxID=2709797 RepID=UPI0013EA1F31|nr:glycosyltransferase [Dysgonomonas sp. ZJ709]
MKLNVLLITYNQEKYIEQTVESILMQETTFAFNIIEADDCSSDSTLDIIKRYADNNKIEFHFLPKTNNLGFVKNYQRAFEACDGEYIAIMEGDDYWISPFHLENHVKFLDQHPECSMSFNRHLRLFEDQNREEIFEWDNEKDYEYISTEQMALGNRIGNLSCCVLRNEFIKKLDPKLFNLEFADWLLGMIMGQYGPLAYLKEVTSAYRIHDNGQWSRMTDKEQGEAIIAAIDIYDKILNYKYAEVFKQHKKRINIGLYGDKSLRGQIKNITPESIRKLYRRIIK